MARIGFIGLGNMGLPMAHNLIKAGHQVEGVDVTQVATDKLKAAGGAVAETAKIAAAPITSPGPISPKTFRHLNRGASPSSPAARTS